MNYVVIDDLQNDYEYNVNLNKLNKYKNVNWKKNRFIILGLLAFIFLIIIVFFISNNSNYYERIEARMISEAKEYVKKNNLNTSSALYITLDMLSNFKISDDCIKDSGIIIEGNLFFPNLVCENYRSSFIKNEEKYGKLIGEEVIFTDYNHEYHDLGIDSNYKFETITNYENSTGVYTFLYKIRNDDSILETIIRKVIVLDSKNSNNFPKISLIGDEYNYLKIGDIYNEQGFIANDSKEGDISSKVNVISNIDYNKIGEYEIKYIVTNSFGYSSMATRKFFVVDNTENSEIIINSISSPIDITSKNVRIIVMIMGDNYKHTVLPNGEIVKDTLISFEVEQNGSYDFLIYDKGNNINTEKVIISNIDKELPIGTCSAITYKQYTEIKIDNVNKKSCVFSYESGDYKSVYMTEKIYKIPVEDAEVVSVNIKDAAGNINKINCTLEKDLSLINKEYINEKGYNCIEPYTCLKQGDYTSQDYCYYSTETCGPIYKRGCSITSVATVLSKWDKRSSSGEIFTPYTLMDEVDVYRHCSSCSGTTTTRRLFESFGLQVVRNPENNNDWFTLNMKNHDILLNHLKTGNPALFTTYKGGWYTDGGHIMSLLAVNEEDLVYLYDTGTKKGTKNSWGHDVNTFVPLTDVINHCGDGCIFQLIKE